MAIHLIMIDPTNACGNIPKVQVQGQAKVAVAVDRKFPPEPVDPKVPPMQPLGGFLPIIMSMLVSM